MNEIILKEAIGTRYVTPYFKTHLYKLFKECLEEFNNTGNKVTVDIKHCKFNPQTYPILTEYYNTINFIDSVNPVIDSILVHNSKVFKIIQLENNKSIRVENIPARIEIKDISEYLKNLNHSTVYRLVRANELNGTSPTVCILIAMAIAYLYPAISIDLSSQTTNYFRMFNKFWMYTGEVKREAYNVEWEGNILKVESIGCDESGNNIFYIPGTGNIDEATLCRNFDVIPYEFGTKDVSTDVELSGIFSKVGAELGALMNKRKKASITSTLSTIERE